MKRLTVLFACALIAGCSSGPSTTDALIGLQEMMTTASTVQADAIQASSQGTGDAHLVPATLNLSFTWPCTGGGDAAIQGTYDDGNGTAPATFADDVTFSSCDVATAELDGALSWTATASGDMFTWTMVGNLDYSDGSTSFSCDYDMSAQGDYTGTTATETFSGSFCGYDVQQDLHFSYGP